MVALVKTHVTAEEYLARERQAQTKSEYYAGEVVGMAGASRKHNLVVFNLIAGLQPQLKGRRCEGYSGDMRVRIPVTDSYVYPDVVVVCGEPQFEDHELDTLLNPTVIIEVLSPTTANFDKGGKFDQYRSLASLQEYVLVAQDVCHVVHYTRQPAGGWLLAETGDLGGHLDLASIGCQVALADVYDKVV